ncbi:LamG-like jellyroll fold domain-containing protein [Streptomyces yaanensis]|uniref:LamG-like jellyroll fold domain-containing protein n=1 Tax=Streptomyces yaanensis TaxID=1142239 RepID=A0ABV7S7L0_9ACTN|nr:LamG-like jellyroll fold domain-containing protein [Streptomyces sp. CGMCC 4.7035]WNC02335.1 LamG-like jellyroll fold domain-containing protein [Streptomyces sp. CGMCC 4.7035]
MFTTDQALAEGLELGRIELPSANLSSIASWFTDPHWGKLPRQQSGTAAGHRHHVSAAATEAGRGAGHKPGKGRGELAAYQAHKSPARAGKSASFHGFNARTSKRVAGRSSSHSTYYRNADGSFSRKVSPFPLNYKDPKGEWRQIDTEVARGPDGRWDEKSNAMDVGFGAKSSDKDLASFDKDGKSVGFGLEGAAQVTGTAQGSTVSYPKVLPDTDLQLTSTSIGMRQALVLHSAKAANSWVFPLELKGLTAKLNKAGGVDLRDANGKGVALIPSAYAFDSKINKVSGERATTHAVKYELITEHGKPALRMTLDAAWLHAKSRVFPVTVDPDTSVWDYVHTTYTESGYSAADRSQEQTIKVGSYDSGTHSAVSFVQDWRDSFDGSGVTMVSANLHLYDIWASTCTPESFNVAQVSSAWDPTDAMTYPGPAHGASIGSVTPSVPNACANTTGDQSGGDWVTVPLDTASIQKWASGTSADYGLAIYATTTDALHWKQFGSMAFPGDEPYIVYDYTGDIAPMVEATFPANNSSVSTLTPELQAFADFQQNPLAQKYDFKVYNSSGTLVVDSGLVTTPNWTVPSGKLAWNTSYTWTAQAYDGTKYSTVSPSSALTTEVPQPFLTSELSQNSSDHGYDATIGNYTTSDTDASISTVGPSLDVERDYNSRDFRTSGAFGAGWSSIFDAKVTEQKNPAGTLTGVVTTYPDGSEVGFGKNSDGTFSPPSGRFAQMKSVTTPAVGYTLTDKDDTVYTFTQPISTGVYGITSVTDANNRSVNFTWTSGHVTKMKSAVSGRSLNLTWSTPTGATYAHVATVVTDLVNTTDPNSAQTWTYGYTNDQLSKVCSPLSTTKCTTYGYTNGSQFRTEVENAGASELWQFNETSGTVAASSVGDSEGTDNATYSNVTLGQAGSLAGSTATAAKFNGTSSYAELPPSLVSSSNQQTMSMWFKTTTAPGVLFSYSTLPLSYTMTQGQYTPGIYVGTDGKLNAEFWNSSGVSPIVSTGAVNDGAWHEVVLAGAGSLQTLYLDGVKVGTRSGMISYSNGYHSALQNHTYIGAGFLGGTWPDEPHYSTTSDNGYPTYFNGTIANVALYPDALTADQVARIHTAATKASPLLTTVTRPSGKAFAGIAYDTNAARVTQVTDENGGVWKLNPATVTGSSNTYRGAILGGAPNQYYRFGESAGASTALDEVHGGTGTYNSVTLGAAGPFTDHTTASFNGTSSKVTLPSGTVPGSGAESVDMWFKTNTTNGVLFGASKDPLGTTTPTSYTPILYVGSSGKLYGEFWFSGGSTKPIGSASAVTDNKWHHVVLSTSATSQSLYLDGNLVGSQTGTAAMTGQPYTYVGAGYLGGNWPDEAHNSSTDNTGYATYFKGSIAEAAFYRSQLSSDDVDAQFDAAKNSSGLLPVKTVTVTTPTNATLSYTYDVTHGNRLLSETDALGNTTSFGYDTAGFEHTVTDPNGSMTVTGHDVRGNIVSSTSCQDQAANKCNTEYYTYYPDDTTAQLTTADPRNDQLLTERDGRSASATDNTYLTSYTYDTAGNQTAITGPAVPGFPNGRTTQTVYSDGTSTYPSADSGVVPAGLPVKTISPGGAVNQVSYFANGDVASTTDAIGLVTSYTYDGLGQVTSQKSVSDTYPSGLTTTYKYDAAGQVTEEDDPQLTDRVTGATHAAVTTTVYDDDGNTTSQTVADARGGDRSRTQTWTYDQYDHVATEADANVAAGTSYGNTTTYTYDTSGNKTKEVTSAGNETRYTYDAEGNLLTQGLMYSGDPVNPQTPTLLTESSRAYDPAGRLASVTDAMGSTTSYTYTDDGLTATVTKKSADGQSTYVLESDSYDAAGNLLQSTTDNGETVTNYTVDAASRTTSTELDPTGVDRVSTVSYTPDDQVASENDHDASGYDRTTTNTYDNMGNLLSETLYGDASGHPAGWWKLDQSSGTTVTDASGTGNTGLATGVTWSDSAANFAGTTGQQIATNSPVVDTTASYTVSAWVKMSSLPTHNATIVSQTGTTNSAFMLQYNYAHSSAPLWSMNQTSKDASGATFPAAYSTAVPASGAWTHLVGVYNASNGAIQVYVNGTLSGSGTNSTPWAATGPLTIGQTKYAGSSADLLPGAVSNVQVYQRALSASEVSSLYGKGRAGGTVGSSDAQTTKYTYDKRGLPSSMTDAENHTTNYEYDEAGNLAVTTAPAVQAEADGTNPATVRPATTSGFNTFGEAVEEKDPNGLVTNTAYDAEGNKVSETLPSYTPAGASQANAGTTVWTYDSEGNQTSVTTPGGKTTSYLYDQMGDLAQTTAPDGTKTHATYDTAGDRLTATDPTGAQTQATYDYLGRQVTQTTMERYPSTRTLTSTTSYAVTTGNPYGAHVSSTTSPGGVTSTYGYNRAGDITSVTDGAGNTTRYAYDFEGNRSKTTLADGTYTTTDYNADGDPTATHSYDASGTQLWNTSQQYDGVGNMTAATDANGHTSQFTYDAAGTITQETQPVDATTSITTTFGYDQAGNRTRFTDGRGNSWRYTYTPWGQQEKVIEPTTSKFTTTADSTTTFAYDADGQLTTATLPGGTTTSMTYDVDGQLKTMSGSGADAATATRSFTYDNDGRVLSADTAEAGTTGAVDHQNATHDAFTYDDRGDLLSTSGSAGTSSFAYNNDGAMTSRTDAAGTTSYGYDTAGRLSSLNDAATGTQLTYTYDQLNNLKTIKYGATGQTRTFNYNTAHELTSDTLVQGASTLASFTYGYDKNGNLTSKTTTGVSGASSNTYGYDWANRLTSWNNGSTTTTYGYDASGNRIRKGSDVYTYDQRDQLTSDGVHSYDYSARGTMTQESSASGTQSFKTDAFGNQIVAGDQAYNLDAMGRNISDRDTSPGGLTRTFAYSGADNTIASDGDFTYTYDPAGGITGVKSAGGGSGSLALTDQHNDVVGTFTSGATALAGSASYDPMGKVVSPTNTVTGHLGFQSGWTEPGTGDVGTASRWYSPDTGQFLNKDSMSLDAVPNSVAANPFAYVDDNPLAGTDESGNCSWYDVVCGAKKAVHHVAHAVRHVAHKVYHAVKHIARKVVHAVKHAAHKIAHRVRDYYHATVRAVRRVYHYAARHVRRAYHRIVHAVHSAYHAVRRAVHRVVHAVKKAAHKVAHLVKKAAHAVAHAARTAYHATVSAAKSAAKFVKHHAAAITSFVVSTAVFAGCEAFTAGIGSIGCAAVAGAAGALVEQGFKCADKGGDDCSVGAFAGSAVEGAVTGAAGGALGELGGKILAKAAPKALEAAGGLFGKGATEATESAASDATDEAAAAAESSGAGTKAQSHSDEAPAEEGASCPIRRPHSFTGSTQVLMADGTTKAIDEIKVGDTIANSVPGAKGTEAHKVTDVIVTHTDHDFADVSIRKTDESAAKSSVKDGAKSLAKKVARKAAFGLAASAAILGALSAGHGHGDAQKPATAPVAAVSKTSSRPVAKTEAEAKAAHLTTTFHHPFYDETQSAFVEAKDLKPGDVLQTPTGTAQVTGVRLYHANTTTYDLTIGTLHTYYVEAGDTPVLVHNANTNLDDFGCGTATRAATWVDEGGFQNSTPPAPSTRSGWFRFQSAATGTRSNLATGRSQVPQYSAPDGNGGTITAKFDSAFGDEAIDRKLGLTGYGKDEAERQAAVAAHHGFKAVYELPSQKKVDQANKLLESWGVTGIATRVGSW